MSCYVFYTHNTFSEYHVIMAMESISNQDHQFSIDEFVIYNNSTDLQSDFILKTFREFRLENKFSKVTVIDDYPETTSVCKDLQFQKDRIKDHDWYLCHKSDFYLPKGFMRNFLNTSLSDNLKPQYLNFCKFDTRETTSAKMLRKMSNFSSFNEMVAQPFTSFSENYKYSPDISVNHLAIGYRGNRNRPTFDGVMHAYNEKARQLLEFNSYWKDEDIYAQRAKGISMEIDKNTMFVLHMFHDIGRTDKMKNVPGHRF